MDPEVINLWPWQFISSRAAPGGAGLGVGGLHLHVRHFDLLRNLKEDALKRACWMRGDTLGPDIKLLRAFHRLESAVRSSTLVEISPKSLFSGRQS